MYNQAQLTQTTGGNSVTLWDVATDLLGPLPKKGSIKPQVEICIETPFGKICFEVKSAELNEKELRKITLGDVFADIWARPRLQGSCFRFCQWGVCVVICV